MIIRHSLQLLEQLSQLEAQIQQLETALKELDREVDTDAILQIVWREYMNSATQLRRPLTARSNVS